MDIARKRREPRRDGDAEYAAFVSATWHRLLRMALLMCGDRQRAEDAVQSGLVRLYISWSRLGHIEAMEAYARKAVVSALLDDAKRPWRRENPVAAPPDTDRVPDDASARVDDRLAVLRALAEVPPRQRAVLVLRFNDDLDVAQTARLLNCSPGTVKSQTSRGLDALHRALLVQGWHESRLRGLAATAGRTT